MDALSYIPQHVIDDLVQHNGQSPLEREQRFQAVILFADVSGFTAISEALGKTGRAGTEELTAILNSYFDPMIDLIESYGGIVGKFGGDAMTVLFPYNDATQAATVRRAIQCALDMQFNMRRYEAIPTSAGTFGLAMKAGLALGTVLATSVGDLETRLEYIIAGSPLDLSADAEHHATRGEVVIHNALLGDAGQIAVVEGREGFTCVGDFSTRPKPQPLKKQAALPEPVTALLWKYLHPRIAELVRGGHIGFINEHRRVTILFVSFGGFEYDNDPTVGDKLKDYLGAVIRTVARYEGYVNKVDMGDKGSKYIILFGAPIAHENDDDRALRCALDLVRLPGAQVRIGVNSGFVYCGQVGSEKRQEYTVMGDAVNLSARLMQYAQPGEIVVSGFTNRLPANAFVFEEREPIMVKGKSEPIPIRLLKDALHPTEMVAQVSYQLPMIGREAELRTAVEKMERAQAGHGQLLGITAEAGMGKSRLTVEIVAKAEQRGLRVHRGECLSYGTNSAYLVWQAIWRGLFGLSSAMSDNEQINHLRDQLDRIDPALVQRLPLLGDVLNLSIPANALTDALEPQLRQELLSSLLLTCLRWYSRQQPRLLVVEDSHWIDDLSEALLVFLGRNIRDLPVMIVQVYRPPVKQAPPSPLMQFPHFTEIALTEFTPAEAERLISAKLEQRFGEADIPADLIERIQARAQGNPFYIEELMNLIHERGIDPSDNEALQNLDLPDSLHSLIVSRIDYLNETDQLTLKVASVIGRLFKASWLWGSYPEVGDPDHIKDQLRHLDGLDIVQEDRPEPELEYLFKHVLTQEVAYESLAYATRQNLHERIGDYIEYLYIASTTSVVDILAYHYGRSANKDKQRIYFRQAGDLARATYNNKAAIDYYERVRALLTGDELVDILLRLSEVHQLIGNSNTAETLVREALETARSGTTRYARCQAALGNLLLAKESSSEALKWLESAHALLAQTNEREFLRETLRYLAHANTQQGKFEEALAYSQQLLAIAQESADVPGLCAAYLNMAVIHTHRGAFDQAIENFRESLTTAEAAGYRYGIMSAAGDMAGVYYFSGSYGEAVRSLQRGLEIAQEIGFLQGEAQLVMNLGEIYRQEQVYDKALACYLHTLKTYDRIGVALNIYYVTGNMATVYAAQNQPELSAQLFEQTIALGRSLGIPTILCEYLQNFAALRHQQGQHDTAKGLNDEALQIASEIGRQDVQFQAALLDVEIRRARGDLNDTAAQAALHDLLEQYPEPPMQADIYYALWEQGDPTAKEQAGSRYGQLYAMLPNMKHYRRYQQFTDAPLQPPPPLPDLPENIQARSPGVTDILHIVEQYR